MDLSRCPDRRCVLVAGAAGTAALLTGCSTYGRTEPAPAAPPAATTASPSAEGSESTDPEETASADESASAEESAAPDVPPLAAVADVPVGGGVVLADAGVVLTRPDDATVKGFSATCTHAGCTVTEVSDGEIRCSCHGSRFAIADGSVTGGPAPSALPAVAVRVKGGQVLPG